MLDRHIAPLIKPAVDAIARWLHRVGVSADHITLMAFFIGIWAAFAIALRWYLVGLVLILISRLYDALDGAVARLSEPTDRGAFLDIALDFLFYASIPLAFAWSAPVVNGIAAATLLAAFIGTGSSFLAYAAIAEKRKAQTGEYPQPEQHNHKGFFFMGGLTEATETLIAFCAMCLWPKYFTQIAFAFAALCLLTIASRLWVGYRSL